MTGFGDRLAAAVTARRSQIVLGLDPDPERIRGGAREIEDFCLRVIDAAAGACVAAKPQLACFERFGADGLRVLDSVIGAAADAGLIVIADGKRGDIDATARAYADAWLRGSVDALTVNPMLGGDATAPFVERAVGSGRGLFVLVRTSNPGAADLQDLALADGRLWHEAVADQVAQWGSASVGAEGLSSVGAVVGATVPGRIAALRARMPNQVFLLPGVGAQGGRPEELGPAFGGVAAGALVSASRSIIYADDPAAAAAALRDTVWEAWRGE